MGQVPFNPPAWHRLLLNTGRVLAVFAYADALRGPCRPMLDGETAMWPRLRKQREARIANWTTGLTRM